MSNHHARTMGAVMSFVLAAVSTPIHSWADAGGQGKAEGNSCMSQCMGFNASSYDASHELTQVCQAQCNVGTGAGSCLATADGCCVPYTGDPDCAAETFADVRLGFEDSTAVMCGEPWSPEICISQDVRVYNDGPVPVTVSVSFSGTYDDTPENSFAEHLINNTYCTGTDDGVSSWSASCTAENVPPNGGSTFLARMWARLGGSHAGSASVTASSSPDPDTSNNTVEWNFTAPLP